MKKLIAKYKKLKADMEKAEARRKLAYEEWNLLTAEIANTLAKKLDGMREDSPLAAYKWAGRFNHPHRESGNITEVVFTASQRKVRDPLRAFFGEVSKDIQYTRLYLQDAVYIHLYSGVWEMRFENTVSPGWEKQIMQFLKDRKIRVSLSRRNQEDYNEAKRFIADCDALLSLVRGGKKK